MALVIGICAYQRVIDAGRFGAAGTGAGFLGCGAGRCCLCAAYDVAIASVPLGRDRVIVAIVSGKQPYRLFARCLLWPCDFPLLNPWARKPMKATALLTERFYAIFGQTLHSYYL